MALSVNLLKDTQRSGWYTHMKKTKIVLDDKIRTSVEFILLPFV
jgi:hypothetical protein